MPPEELLVSLSSLGFLVGANDAAVVMIEKNTNSAGNKTNAGIIDGDGAFLWFVGGVEFFFLVLLLVLVVGVMVVWLLVLLAFLT